MGGGSGGSQTTTVDPVYNAGMLKLSEEQQGWGRQMFNMFKYGVTYDPNEKVASGGEPLTEQKWVEEQRLPASQGGGLKNRMEPRVIPGHYETITREATTTRGELEGYDPNAQTSEMRYLQNLVEANQSLLGLKTGAQKKRLDLYNTYMGDINKGIDVGARMDQAQAGVQHGFKNANRAARMDIASYGLDPSSGRYASSNRARSMAEGAGIAGARTTAKNLAEQEDFQRKTIGLQIQ